MTQNLNLHIKSKLQVLNTILAVQEALARWRLLLLLFFFLLWQKEKQSQLLPDQLKLGKVCKIGEEFDNTKNSLLIHHTEVI